MLLQGAIPRTELFACIQGFHDIFPPHPKPHTDSVTLKQDFPLTRTPRELLVKQRLCPPEPVGNL